MPPCDDSMVCTSGETGHCDPKRDSRSGPCRVLLIIADPVVANPRAIRRLQDRLLAPCPIVRTACQPLDPWIKKSFDNSPIAAASGQSRPVHFSIEHCRQVSIANPGRGWPVFSVDQDNAQHGAAGLLLPPLFRRCVVNPTFTILA